MKRIYVNYNFVRKIQLRIEKKSLTEIGAHTIKNNHILTLKAHSQELVDFIFLLLSLTMFLKDISMINQNFNVSVDL